MFTIGSGFLYNLITLVVKGEIMNINPITTNNETNFKGQLHLKGEWPYGPMAKIFSSQPCVKKTLENYSLTADMKMFTHRFLGEKYKLSLSVKKDNPTIWEKIKYAFGLSPKTDLSRHYHSERGTDAIIKNRLEHVLKNDLNVEL